MSIRYAAAHTTANTLHAATSIGTAYATYQTTHIPHTPTLIPALTVFALTAILLGRPTRWLITQLTRPTGPARTGPEFAHRHGNDSSTWTLADFETALNLAAIDAQPAWTALHPKPTPHTTTHLTRAA